MICPKCGFEQPDRGIDCLRCGIVFSRYRATASGVARPGSPPAPEVTRSGASGGVDTAAAGTVYGGEPAMGGQEPARGGQEPARGGQEPAVVGMALRPAPARPSPPGGRGLAPGHREMSIAPGRGVSSGVGPPFRLGEVLGDVFSIYFENLLPFILMAVAVIAPLFVFLLLMRGLRGQGALLVIALTSIIEAVLITPLVTGAVTYGVVQELREREASIGDCLRLGLSSLGRVFSTALLQGLAILAGCLLCLVPGLIAAAAFSVAIPAALEDEPGTAALRRSADLTRGHRLAVFGVLLTLGVIQYALARAVMMVAAPARGGSPISLLLPSLAISPLGMSLSATAAAVMYYRLRSSQEGIDVATFTSVFD